MPYLELKEKLLATFNSRNIKKSLEEKFDEQINVLDLDNATSKYNGRSFIINKDDTGFFVTVKESGERIELSFEETTKCLRIINKKSKAVTFIPIDGRGTISQNNFSFCDFIFFSSNFYFCEFKLNASTNNYLSIRDNREKAKKQLSNTIKWFDGELAGDYQGVTKKALLVSPPHFPKINANIQELQLFFLEEFQLDFLECSNQTVEI